jgi:hypothetical protein
MQIVHYDTPGLVEGKYAWLVWCVADILASLGAADTNTMASFDAHPVGGGFVVSSKRSFCCRRTEYVVFVSPLPSGQMTVVSVTARVGL